MITLRHFFATGILALCVVLLAPAAQAQSAQSAPRMALEGTINQVLDELKKPALKNSATRDASLAKIEKIILGLFDFDKLCASTVGPQWKNFTAAQKSNFKEAFIDLLRERYIGALLGYNGETVSYLKETPIGSKGDKVLIDTTINVKNKPVAMSYRLQNTKRWMVYDISIEGVGMVRQYQGDFSGVLTNGTPDDLITSVRDLAEKTRLANKNK